MTRASSLSYALLVSAVAFLSAANSAAHAAVGQPDQGTAGDDLQAAGDASTGLESVATNLAASETPSAFDTEEQATNKKLANSEGEDLRVTLRCADWGVVAFTTRHSLNDFGYGVPDVNDLKDFGFAGFTLHAYPKGDGQMPLEACPKISDAHKTRGYPSGAETSFSKWSKTYANFVMSFWRVGGVPALGTPAAAESALSTAVQKCISENKVSIAIMKPMVTCLNAQLIAPKNGVFTFLTVVSDKLADTIGENLGVEGLVRKSLSVTSGGLTRELTFVAMRR